jgi:uncharacterized membrane protein
VREPADRRGDRAVARIEAFSDGVFAIAITLLVLQLVVPGPRVPEADLPRALHQQIPKFLSFGLSFWVIGRYWVAHHGMFAYIARHDSTFLFLNLLLLFVVVFLPYPTALLGEHGDKLVPVLFYASTITAVSLASALLWWYASHGHRLIHRDIDPGFIRLVQLRALSAGVVFLLSIPLAIWNLNAAFVAWAAFFPLIRLGLRRRAARTPGAAEG